MKKHFGAWVTGLAVLALVFSAACAKATPSPSPATPAPTPAAPAKKSIKVGMSISTSGPFALASMQGLEGAKIWVDEVNKKGGIFVRDLGLTLPVELVYYDDRSDKEVTTKMYEKLVVEDGIDVAMANYSSTLTLAAAPITERYKKLLLAWTASSDLVYQQGYEYLVGTVQVNSRQAELNLDLLVATGVKSMAIIYADNAWGVDMGQAWKRSAEQRGVKVVLHEMFPTGTLDFSPLFRKAKAANPDAFIMSDFIGAQITAAKQMKELGINFPFAHFQFTVFDDWYEALGKDGLYFTGNSMWAPDLNYDTNVGMNNAEFMAKHKAMFGDSILTYNQVLLYGSGVILEKLIQDAGGLDAAKLKKAALNLSGTLDTITGRWEIDETGAETGQAVIPMQRVPDPATGKSKLIIVAPKSVATGDLIYPMPTWAEKK